MKITTKKVKERIKQLRRDAAEGPDSTGLRILQEMSDGLAQALVIIYH